MKSQAVRISSGIQPPGDLGQRHACRRQEMVGSDLCEGHGQKGAGEDFRIWKRPVINLPMLVIEQHQIEVDGSCRILVERVALPPQLRFDLSLRTVDVAQEFCRESGFQQDGSIAEVGLILIPHRGRLPDARTGRIRPSISSRRTAAGR